MAHFVFLLDSTGMEGRHIKASGMRVFTLGNSLQIPTHYSFSTTRAKHLLLRRHISDSELKRKDLPVHNISQAWFYIALGRGCTLV